jgi:nucleoside phosphorylase
LGDVEMAENGIESMKSVKVAAKSVRPDQRLTIAVCVALDMERQILVKRWKLKGGYPKLVWEGKLGDVDVILFGTEGMGRVGAAIATMQFLHTNPKPAMLLVAGIAGGFEREQVKRGDLLIPKSVADLATRKIGNRPNNAPELRPREFRTDERLLNFVRSNAFDLHGWESSVVGEADWPDGLRPTIHDGPVASLDEVVSSSDWVDALCNAWPKLCGVEMEAGGACAAADTYQLKVAVVRGVSDLADPTKSDDSWRQIAMKTVAHLIESIDFARLLA